jgi:hypothetical protein
VHSLQRGKVVIVGDIIKLVVCLSSYSNKRWESAKAEKYLEGGSPKQQTTRLYDQAVLARMEIYPFERSIRNLEA